MDAQRLVVGRPTALVALGAAAKTSPGVVLSRARTVLYGRSLRPSLARFSRARASTAPPGGPLAACATVAERRAAKRAGLRTSLIGLAGVNGLPDGELLSFGLAGALNGLDTGTVVDAVRVVDEEGRTLWEGEPLGVPGARQGTILAAGRVIDDPAERRRLHESTGADIVDLESGALAASGRLRGCLRAVSDTPERTLHGICNAVTLRGTYNWPGLLGAFGRSPRGFAQAAGDARVALASLTAAARKWTA